MWRDVFLLYLPVAILGAIGYACYLFMHELKTDDEDINKEWRETAIIWFGGNCFQNEQTNRYARRMWAVMGFRGKEFPYEKVEEIDAPVRTDKCSCYALKQGLLMAVSNEDVKRLVIIGNDEILMNYLKTKRDFIDSDMYPAYAPLLEMCNRFKSVKFEYVAQ